MRCKIMKSTKGILIYFHLHPLPQLFCHLRSKTDACISEIILEASKQLVFGKFFVQKPSFRPSFPFITSSETQGQLVGTTGFSWAKVYNKSGTALGHLLLPIQFQKRLNSLLLIGQKFLANQRRGTAGRLSCLLTRGCFPHQSP